MKVTLKVSPQSLIPWSCLHKCHCTGLVWLLWFFICKLSLHVIKQQPREEAMANWIHHSTILCWNGNYSWKSHQSLQKRRHTADYPEYQVRHTWKASSLHLYLHCAYPSALKVAEALIRTHPCLKDRGSSSGFSGWKTSIKYKMANYRTKLSGFGIPDVTCNALEHKCPDDRKSAENVKKAIKAEVITSHLTQLVKMRKKHGKS